MAQRRNGAMAQRRNGAMAQWQNGINCMTIIFLASTRQTFSPLRH